MVEKINIVRRDLDKILETKELTDKKVLEISKKLDILILEYYENINKEMINEEK